jgi:hypothetical protein
MPLVTRIIYFVWFNILINNNNIMNQITHLLKYPAAIHVSTLLIITLFTRVVTSVMINY